MSLNQVVERISASTGVNNSIVVKIKTERNVERLEHEPRTIVSKSDRKVVPNKYIALVSQVVEGEALNCRHDASKAKIYYGH